jgi:hypothetical protein
MVRLTCFAYYVRTVNASSESGILGNYTGKGVGSLDVLVGKVSLYCRAVFSIIQPQPAAWLGGWVVARPAAGRAG